MIEQLERRMLLAAVSWDGGGDGINWTNAANWSGDALPGLADDVTISLPAANPTIQLTSGTQTINSLISDENLTISGGTLFLDEPSRVNATLTLSGGTIDDSGDLTVGGSLQWSSGTMQGNGKTIIAPGGSITLSSVNSKNLSRILQIDVGGSATWTAGTLFMSGGTLNNNGSFTANTAAGNLTAQSDGSASTVNNAGTFTKMGSGTANFNLNSAALTFNNTEIVNVDAGTLGLNSGGAHNDNFTVATGATLSISGNHTFSAGALSGEGNFTVTGGTSTHSGTVDIDGAATFSAGAITFNGPSFASGSLNVTGGTANFSTVARATTGGGTISGGTLGGTGELSFSGALAWTGGTMSGLTGKTIISGTTGNLSISGSNSKNLSRILQIDVGGSATWTAGNLLMSGANLNNNGSFTANSTGGNLNAQSDGSNSAFNNAGTFTKMGNNNVNFNFNSAALAFNNTEIVNVDAGTLGLNSGGAHNDNFTVASGATLNISRDHTFSPDSQITGEGNLTVAGGTSTHSGTIGIQGAATFSGGAITFNGPSFASGTVNITGGTANFSTVARATTGGGTISGGTLDGTGELSFSGAVNWTGGTMTGGTGKTIIAQSGTLSISGASRILSRILQNDGATTWTGGFLDFRGGTFNNTSNAFFTADSTSGNLSAFANTGGPPSASSFNNAGTFTKTGSGSGSASFSLNSAPLAFSNTGTVLVSAGTLALNSVVSQISGNTLTAGTWQVDAGATLAMPTSPSLTVIRTIGADARVILNGPGSTFIPINGLTTNNGTFKLENGRNFGAQPLGGTFTNNGTIHLNRSTLTVTGTFTQSASGTIRHDLAGPDAADMGLLNVTGAVSLAGTMQAFLLNNYDPNHTISFAVITGFSRAGIFNSVILSDTPSLRRLSLRYPANGVVLNVTPRPPSTPDLTAASDSGRSATDDITNVTTPTFTGFADDGTTVTIYSTGVEIGSGVATGGQYSITVSTLAEGPHSIEARARDSDLDMSYLSLSLPIVIDTTAPGTPPAPDLLATSDSGRFNDDDITSDRTPTFTFGLGLDLIRLLSGTTILADYAPSGSVTSAFLGDGVFSITARGIDVAGNVGDVSPALSVTIDTLAPAAPTQAPDLQSGSDSGRSSFDNITNVATPTFTVPAPELVQIRFGNVVRANYATPPSVAILPTIGDPNGTVAVTAHSIDLAGNLSAASPALSITIDTIAPDAPTEAPDLQATSDSGISSSDNITNVITPIFTVNTAELVNLLVNGVVEASYATPSGVQLSFSPGLNAGLNFRAQSVDIAGNVSALSPTLLVQFDTDRPSPVGTPDLTDDSDTGVSRTDNITNDNTPTFSVSRTELVRLVSGSTILADYVGQGGDVASSLLSDGAHGIVAHGIDLAGNVSLPSPMLNITIDTIAPAPPSAPPDLSDSSDTGFDNSDNVTNDNTPSFEVDAPELVNLIIDGSTVIRYASPGFIHVFATLFDGSYQFRAQSVDAAGNLSVATAALPVTIDTDGPDVVTRVFNFLTSQQVVFSFNEDVGGTLAPARLELQNLTTSTTVPAASIALAYAANTATFTFPGFPNGVLPDGDYRARLTLSAVGDRAGNPLAPHTALDFFTLVGDLNRDRSVTISDFIDLASNFNKTNAVFTDGDMNYDGLVSISDFLDLAGNFNKTLGPPPPAATAAMAAASATLSSDTPSILGNEKKKVSLFDRSTSRKARHHQHPKVRFGRR